MNVRTIIEQMHAQAAAGKSAGAEFDPLAAASAAADLARLRAASEQMANACGQIGKLPPSPDTLRGLTGKFLVKAVQRMLFWYTPAIATFQGEAAAALEISRGLIEQQQAMISVLQKMISALQKTISALQKEVKALRYDREAVSVPAAWIENRIPPAFEFALQNDFRGSERETGEKLGVWLDEIREAGHPAALARDWLDIGCGRGEWLALAGRGGQRVIGIDPSPITIDHCRALNLRVEQGDALEFLQRREDATLGVVTAFHVVEHLPLAYLIELAALVARKLAPGGVFAIETPNPANLLMGANNFWNDPTHLRPIPLTLMRFIFEYFSLTVAKTLDLNPFPPGEQLPYREIEPVTTVNRHLYGPRDYGIIGLRET